MCEFSKEVFPGVGRKLVKKRDIDQRPLHSLYVHCKSRIKSKDWILEDVFLQTNKNKFNT